MITYVTGDATYPVVKPGTNAYIVHVCNDIGCWGAGFVLAVSKRWKQPEEEYLAEDLPLGAIQIIEVEDDIFVVNVVAQRGVGGAKRNVNYKVLRKCLVAVNDHAVENNAELHMPRIGAGLGGGDWKKIEQIINDSCTVAVTVYDLPKPDYSVAPFERGYMGSVRGMYDGGFNRFGRGFNRFNAGNSFGRGFNNGVNDMEYNMAGDFHGSSAQSVRNMVGGFPGSSTPSVHGSNTAYGFSRFNGYVAPTVQGSDMSDLTDRYPGSSAQTAWEETPEVESFWKRADRGKEDPIEEE